MFKKILSIILIMSIALCMVSWTAKAEESISVYITVTDITDHEEPFNVLVKRQPLTVSEFDISLYGDTLTDIQTIGDITYIHALIQLHINLYGADSVGDYFMLTNKGETKYFMGRSVANVMYKNGEDIYTLPQNVIIKDGDEIQVCLYDEGHSQAIATFSKAKINNIAVNEDVSMSLHQHYGHPRDNDPIPDAEIVDDKGRYIINNNDIIKTDDDGKFSVSFDKPGEYIVSAMPEVNYYMTDTGGGSRIEYVPQEVTKLVEVTYEDKSKKVGESVTKLSKESAAAFTSDPNAQVIIFEWADYETSLTPDDEEWISETDGEGDGGVMIKDIYHTYTVTEEHTITELVPVEIFTTDELTPMITYTTPFMIIEVTGKPIISSISVEDSELYFNVKNADLNRFADVHAAAYDWVYDDEGNKTHYQFKEYKKAETLNSSGVFGFNEIHDVYKLMIWENGTMSPLCTAAIAEK